MSISFSKNPEIIVENGKIIRLIMEDSYIEREFNFESEVKTAMISLAYSDQSEFMRLYLKLTNDETFSRIASEIYKEHINKEFYPYEIMKSLSMSDLHLSKVSELSFLIDKNYVKLLISDGLVVEIMSKVIYMGACYRTEIIFFRTLNDIAYKISNSGIKNFMEFYEAVKNDPVAFKIAEDIRKKLLESTQQELENKTKKIQSEIDLLSCT